MKVADVGFGALLGVALVCLALIQMQRIGVTNALTVSAAVLAVAALLAWLGAATASLMGLRVLRGNPALGIGLGQCVLMTWFALRSLVARFAESLGWSSPGCHDAELIGVAVVLIGFSAWRERARDQQGSGGVGAVLAFVLSGVAAVALCELPRLVSLTSDPDQHAFFTQQLFRLGFIPWHQASWGPLDFQYPAGLALLARVWMLGGAVNAVEAVMIQPLVQSLLAVTAFGIWFGQTRGGTASQPAGGLLPRDRPLLGAVLAGSLFFSLLPFSLIDSSKGLEKTGSLSSLLLLALVCALLLEACRAACGRRRRAALCVCAVLLALTGLLNPVALLIPLIASLVVLIALRVHSRQPVALTVLMGGVLFTLVLLSDPYYLNRFLLSTAPTALDVPPGFQAEPVAPKLTEYLDYLRNHVASWAWLRPWFQIPYLGHAPIAMGIVIAGLAALWRAPQAWRRQASMVALGVPAGCTLLGLLLLPVFHVLRHRGDMYLLEPYLAEGIARTAYLWLFACLLFTLASWLLQLRLRAGWNRAVLVLVLLAIVPVAALREQLPTEVLMASRVNKCGDTTCRVADDLKLIQEAQALLRSAPGDLPVRVLVPNRQLDIWRERWLLPVGFARALPIHLDAPLAFFYGKGDADFNYANYDAHVCKRLDVAWLRARRVEYLFVPSDHAKACVAGLDELLRGNQVVLRSGRAALVRL